MAQESQPPARIARIGANSRIKILPFEQRLTIPRIICSGGRVINLWNKREAKERRQQWGEDNRRAALWLDVYENASPSTQQRMLRAATMVNLCWSRFRKLLAKRTSVGVLYFDELYQFDYALRPVDETHQVLRLRGHRVAQQITVQRFHARGDHWKFTCPSCGSKQKDHLQFYPCIGPFFLCMECPDWERGWRAWRVSCLLPRDIYTLINLQKWVERTER
jgi:hypothetical protein